MLLSFAKPNRYVIKRHTIGKMPANNAMHSDGQGRGVYTAIIKFGL